MPVLTPGVAVAMVPVFALFAGLPFVNRLEPTVLGLPLLLCWILGWVMATPFFLYLAYRLGTRAEAPRSQPQGRTDEETR